jgi:hypothetical protein
MEITSFHTSKGAMKSELNAESKAVLRSDQAALVAPANAAIIRDVNASAAIDVSKLSGVAASPLYYQLTSSFTPSSGSPGTTLFSPFNLGGTSGSGLTVAAQTYAFEMIVQMVGTATAVSRTLTASFANSSATISRVIANVVTSSNATQITPAVTVSATYMANYNQTSGASFALEPTRSASSTIYRESVIRGFIQFSSTGKFLPGIQYTTNGETSVTIYGGSTIMLTPVSGTTSNGTWT